MQLGFDKPDAYFAVPPDERATRVLMTPDHVAIDSTHYFLRGVLETPIRGEEKQFGWGVWVKLSHADFKRYVAAEELDDMSKIRTLPGKIASQLPGLPQTLGLAVRIRPVDGRRPLIDLEDADHPLVDEQRNGIHIERALEHLGGVIHRPPRESFGRDFNPVLRTDGWQIDDALARFRAREGVYWLPDAADRKALQMGELVKLVFAIEASNIAGEPEVMRERMWVKIDLLPPPGARTRYSGFLTNQPFAHGRLREGSRVWFGPEHIIDIVRADESKASEADGVLRCDQHGASQKAYICKHLAEGSGLGFHRADEPDNPRPDAWCDVCDEMLLARGAWDEEAEAAAGVVRVCAGCYDAAESRNTR